MRISTAPTRRAIDRWKDRTSSEASRFYVSTAAILASFSSSLVRGRFFFALVLVPATMINFAFSELALFTLLCFLTAKLYRYRLVNSFLKFVRSPR